MLFCVRRFCISAPLAYPIVLHLSWCCCSSTAPSPLMLLLLSSGEELHRSRRAQDCLWEGFSAYVQPYHDACQNVRLRLFPVAVWMVLLPQKDWVETIPRNLCSSVLLVGNGILTIASIFLGSGLTPSAESTRQGIWSLILHLFLFSFSPDSWFCPGPSWGLHHADLCLFKTIMSSWSFAAFSIPSMICATSFWKISAALWTPNGGRLKQ